MLDDRKAAILRAVVEEYIDTAVPVGSGHLARSAGIDVSPATIRNEMAALERDGYLAQPHTSAGRVPTEKGYRFFVDSLDTPGILQPSQRQQVKSFFAHAHGELEQMLAETSRLLSNLTDHTAVVVQPGQDRASVRSVQLVSLAPRTALLVVVLASGSVEKRTLEFATDVAEDRAAAASAHLAAHLSGMTLQGAADRTNPPPSCGDQWTDEIVASALASLRQGADDEGEQVYVGGAARMAQAFEAVQTVRRVLELLEHQLVVVSLLHDVLDRGLSVAIGTETGLEPLAECAVVVAPYEVDGQAIGTIGILGPARMNYPQALAAVATVSQRLGHRLSEG
ncbi:MAG: heat-inducible transcriptional repressor HrcA [Acidimicrobiales bacterium]